MPRWLRVFVAVSALLVFGLVGWALTPAPLPKAELSLPNLEASWNETIARLGIDPVYPPEEDLVVGDLLARVVNDEPDPNQADKLKPTSSFLKRAVKIAHIDLRKHLGTAYNMITMFPPSLSLQASSKENADEHDFPHREFTKDLLQSELPRAAFPSLKIQGLNTAAFGISAGNAGSANYGATNQGVEELHLFEVRTYGLPSARALEALSTYCADEKTRSDCLEETARMHLEQFIGPRIHNQYVDGEGNNKYGVTVEIAVVNRVYVTNKILNIRRTGTTQGGKLAALFGGYFRGLADTKGREDEKQSAQPASPSSGSDKETENMRKRLADVEAQLSKLSPGGVLMFEAESGTEILWQETFERPITFGIRTVRHDFSENAKAEAK